MNSVKKSLVSDFYERSAVSFDGFTAFRSLGYVPNLDDMNNINIGAVSKGKCAYYCLLSNYDNDGSFCLGFIYEIEEDEKSCQVLYDK